MYCKKRLDRTTMNDPSIPYKVRTISTNGRKNQIKLEGSYTYHG